GHDNAVYVARPGGTRVRVNPAGTSADALHLAPGLALAPGGELYVTWAARRPKADGVLFASDLQLSRSLDAGRSFEPPVRVSDDTPTSHSFEGVTVAPDGAVLVSWIETRPGGKPHTYLARVLERGTQVERAVRIDDDETCVCCRVALASAAPSAVAILWRKVFPADVRDMVLARSDDGGRTVGRAERVHDDGWRITACPHRGGSVAIDGRGRAHALWYTEGRRNEPDVLYAVAADGRRFGAPQRVHVSAASIPDHARLAVGADGRAVIVWEDATAVRRRVLLREARGGRLGPVRVLSEAVKGYAPDVAVGPGGAPFAAWHEEHFPRIKTIVRRVR
ncbi:MAG TPA: sialidase family protein, partial [Terriglobales bacterium]|nr:sialidase family protein [Terriglobales bacterium]